MQRGHSHNRGLWTLVLLYHTFLLSNNIWLKSIFFNRDVYYCIFIGIFEVLPYGTIGSSFWRTQQENSADTILGQDMASSEQIPESKVGKRKSCS